MKTSWIDRETSEIVDEEEKMRETNEELERFKKECQGEKTSEEKDDFVNRFEEYMDKCGPMFELNVIPTLEGPIVTGKTNASYAFYRSLRECLQMKLKSASQNAQRLLEWKCEDS